MTTRWVNWTRFEFGVREGFLLHAVLPGSKRVRALVGDDAEQVLDRLDERTECVVFHLNLTLTDRLPLDRALLVDTLTRNGVRVLNHGCTDISKRHVQQVCRRAGIPTVTAGPDGDPDEMVIVKTDWNYHGGSESALSEQDRSVLGYPPALPATLDGDYPVRRRAEIGPRTWDAEDVVIERYVTNRLDRFHRAYVAGEILIVSGVTDPAPLKKMPEGIPRVSRMFSRTGPDSDEDGLARAAGTARRFAAAAGIEFGALDVVSDDEERMHVVDANLTPWWGAGGHPDLLAALADGLTAGAHR